MRSHLMILFLFLFIKGYSQSQEDEYRKMIDSAINLKVQDYFKVPGNLSTGGADKKSLYLIDENNFPYKYTSMPMSITFKTIDMSYAGNRNVLKHGIHAWKIIPFLKSNKMTVRIIDFLITYKNNSYNFANGGGSEIVFEYLCNENKWVLVKTKNQGL
jgi:hypothetical protein